jgi:hypothetical protein
VANEVIQWAGLRIGREPGILEVAFHQTATFQRASDACRDLLTSICKSLDWGAATGRNTGSAAPTL